MSLTVMTLTVMTPFGGMARNSKKRTSKIKQAKKKRRYPDSDSDRDYGTTWLPNKRSKRVKSTVSIDLTTD